MEDRHPNIDEIIKVLKHLAENRLTGHWTIIDALKMYEDWNKKCIEEIDKKNENRKT